MRSVCYYFKGKCLLSASLKTENLLKVGDLINIEGKDYIIVNKISTYSKIEYELERR